MLIRPETPGDYAAMTDLNIRAFDQRLSEALIVALLRQRRRFDPELSLVAEVDGKVVGHVLFSPYVIRLLGENVSVVNLAPIAIDPAYQRQGIGARLIETGHRLAREKGYTLSVLLGHPEYYPRFGYKVGVYAGASTLETATAAPMQELETRKPVEADIPLLQALWLREEAEVDFALTPGDSLLDWLSPNPLIEAQVYLRQGEIVGYTRIHRDEATAPRFFIARDQEAAQTMAGQIGQDAVVKLPLHPYSASSSAFNVKPALQMWNAEMACPLAPSLFDDFYAKLQAGERLPGRIIWTTMFDL